MRSGTTVIQPNNTVECLATHCFQTLALKLDLPRLLAARSIVVRPATPSDIASSECAAVLTSGPSDPDHVEMRATAAKAGISTISISDSWIENRWRLGEYLPESSQDDDHRLQRLIDVFGSKLDADAVSALVASLPMGEHDLNRGKQTVIWAAFSALARTEHEVLEEHCFAGLDLLRGGSDSTLPSSRFGARNHSNRGHRDKVRRVLATEALFNALPKEASVLAAALDEVVTAIGKRRRSSVSVVINNYNYGTYVKDAISSALKQSVAPAEIIVIDDGSTDSSTELIAGIPGILPVFKSNGGQASAINEGFKRATGDVIIFLDADDILLPNAVERVSGRSLRGVSRFQFGLETVNEVGTPLGPYATDGRLSSGWLCGTLGEHGIFPFMPMSGNAFPRNVLEYIFPIPEQEWRLCADLYIVLACAILGETIDLGEVLGQYRIHGRNRYFRSLGSEPYLVPKLQEQRARAWRKIAAQPVCATNPALAERLKLQLKRLLLLQSLEARNRSVAETGKALLSGLYSALICRTITPSTRFRYAVSCLERTFGNSKNDLGALVPNKPNLADLVVAAGSAKWPFLTDGEQVQLASSVKGAQLIGMGWSWGKISGLRSESPESHLAFRLPEVGTNWRASLEFEVAGESPIRGVRISLNGIHIDEFDLHGRGLVELTLPVELLYRWSQICAGPGAFAACLTLRVPTNQADRFFAHSLRLRMLPMVPIPAPTIPASSEVFFSRNCDRSPAKYILSNGWDWRDDYAVTMTGEHASLSLSLHQTGRCCICFQLGSRLNFPITEALQVSVNETMVEIHLAPDGTSFSFVVDNDVPNSSGRLKIDFWLGPDPATFRWPDLRLTALRVDALETDDGRLILGPNMRTDADLALRRGRDEFRGQVFDGKRALLDGRFTMEVALPPRFGPARLAMHITSGVPLWEPGAAEVCIGNRSFRYWLGNENLIDLEVPEDTESPAITIALGDDHKFFLHSVQLHRSSQAAPVKDSKRKLASKYLDAKTLPHLVVVPDHWYPETESALWFSVHRTGIRLPPLPRNSRYLDITVITQLSVSQRIRLSCGETLVETSRGGVETLRLPIPKSELVHGPLIVLEADCLVAANAVGASGPGMLGGAVCAIRIVENSRAASKHNERPGIQHTEGVEPSE